MVSVFIYNPIPDFDKILFLNMVHEEIWHNTCLIKS